MSNPVFPRILSVPEDIVDKADARALITNDENAWRWSRQCLMFLPSRTYSVGVVARARVWVPEEPSGWTRTARLVVRGSAAGVVTNLTVAIGSDTLVAAVGTTLGTYTDEETLTQADGGDWLNCTVTVGIGGNITGLALLYLHRGSDRP